MERRIRKLIIFTALASDVCLHSAFGFGEQVVIYDDTLVNGFQFAKWDPATANLSYTADKYAGTACINMTFHDWSTIFLTRPQAKGWFTKHQYNTIEFYIKELPPVGQPVTLVLSNNPWPPSIAQLTLEKYLPNGATAVWTKVSIPLSEFGDLLADSSQIGGVQFGDWPPHFASTNPNVYYGNILIDNLRFVNLADATPPALVSANNVMQTAVRMVFSEKIDPATAVGANFRLSSTDDPAYSSAVTPSGAAMDSLSPGTGVLLTFAVPLTSGKHYTASASNIMDLSGNAMAANAAKSFAIALRSVQFAIDASKPVNLFNPMIRGMGFGSWSFGWARPYPDKVPALIELGRAMKVGIIRFAGGNSVNDMVWSRDNSPTVTGNLYRADEIDGVAAFADSIGAQVMMQVNTNVNNPAMWADLVKYCNVDHHYKVKYWELGNEWDWENLNTPQIYADRFIAYRKQMLAVDSTIKFCGPVTANFGSDPTRRTWYAPLINACKQDNRDLDVFTYHWYQSGGGSDSVSGAIPAVLFNYSTTFDKSSYPYDSGSYIRDDHWLLIARRRYPEYCLNVLKNDILSQSPHTLRGITELGVTSNTGCVPVKTNFVGALWVADMLGRLAYNGMDLATWWEMYDQSNGLTNNYGIVYPDKDDGTPNSVTITPAFYTYLMYAQYFGDTLVQSTSSDYINPAVPDSSKPSKVSIWASKDSKDPKKLKLMVVNLSDEYYAASFTIAGFTPQSGVSYVLTSQNPLCQGVDYNSAVRINGVTVSSVPGRVASSIAAIPARAVAGAGTLFNYTLPAYTVTSIVLSTTAQRVVNPKISEDENPISVLNGHLAGRGSAAPIQFLIRSSSTARIAVYSLSGELIRSIEKARGLTRAAWDLKSKSGIVVPHGLYLYRVLLENGQTITGSVIVATR